MNRRRILMTGFLCSIVVSLAAIAVVSAAIDWPPRWHVNGNGESGVLDITVEDSGVVTARLFEESVEVLVSGRHLVIHRDTGRRTEIWEGWLSVEKAGSQRIVAGTISVDEDGQTRVYPWYGTLVVTDSPSPPPVVVAPVSPEPTTSTASEQPAEAEATVTVTGGPLSGTWVTMMDERMEIGQDGKKLTVKTPDGSSHSGRMTGAASLVVGLRKGCCNGTLESPDVIVWSDGARWERTD